ncbi:hypothetical protein M405DRAFT_810892, partial [Rhizopogon salebrosus TDB-379]
CATDGERAGSSTEFNPGEHRPAFSPVTRGNSPAGLDRRPSRLSPLLGVPWSRSLMQGLAGGGYCQLVDLNLSEKEEVQC